MQVLGRLDLALADSRYGFDLGVSEDLVEAVLTEHAESTLVYVHPTSDTSDIVSDATTTLRRYAAPASSLRSRA
jgi:hypothetical protein